MGCPIFCKDWFCVDLYPKDKRVIQGEAIRYMLQNPNGFEVIKAFNLIEHLPNVGDFFEAAKGALHGQGELRIRTDNAEWFPFYVPVLNMLSWGAHSSDKYWPPIMNGTKHYSVFTKLHLAHFAELYGFRVLEMRRVTCGARLLAVLRKEARG